MHSITELEARHNIASKQSGEDSGGVDNGLNEIIEHYGWWWTVKVIVNFDALKEDEIYKWNCRRFYNEIRFLQDMEKFKEFQTFINRNK